MIWGKNPYFWKHPYAHHYFGLSGPINTASSFAPSLRLDARNNKIREIPPTAIESHWKIGWYQSYTIYDITIYYSIILVYIYITDTPSDITVTSLVHTIVYNYYACRVCLLFQSCTLIVDSLHRIAFYHRMLGPMASTISYTATCAETEAKCFLAPHADQAYFPRSPPWRVRSLTAIALFELSEASLAKAWKMTWLKVSVETSRQTVGKVRLLEYCVRSIWISFLICLAIRLRLNQYYSQDLVQSKL